MRMKPFPIWLLHKDTKLISDNISTSGSSGKLDGLGEHTSIAAVVNFVENCLPEFADRYKKSSIENEEGLNQILCMLLNAYARENSYPFAFQSDYREEPESGNSFKPDFGAIPSSISGAIIESAYYPFDKSFFSLEAKRLYNTSGQREKEYLIGRKENGKYIDCGGVERFKKGIHGRELHHCGMIGYVQKNDFEYWHRKINLWVDELIASNNNSTVQWTDKDKLIKKSVCSTTAKYISNNSRGNGNNITLYHLWVNFITGRLD